MARLLRDLAPFDVTLGDDLPVRLRPLKKSDRERARRAYGLLSEESRMNRFWEKPRELSPSRAASLTDTDNRSHVAWVALPVEECEIPAYGAASFWRDEADSEDAELAFTVGDQWQRRGFATLLFSVLWFDGWRTGLRRFHGCCRRENVAMAAWWESVGGVVVPAGRQHELAFELVSPEDFVNRISFGMPSGPRPVEVAEWMRQWLDKFE
ncbi:MAG: GNAT family N-acetyltransferase [Verrucomicrobiales bacterium]